MTLPTKSLATFVGDMVATWGSDTGIVPTFESGDVLLALWQSVATQMTFLQAQIQIVLALTRAQTSNGSDLDSWMGQFGFTRLPGTYATTTETFIKLIAASSPVNVPVGAVVQTLGGAIQYQVVADTTQATYNASASAYILPAGATTLSATVQALVAGSTGNVGTGAISQLGSSVPGIDQVTNGAPVTNGQNAETDTQFRARFVLWLGTLARATRAAILAAAQGVQQGVQVTLEENILPSGAALYGCFTAIIDDGTGNPPASLLTSVYTAVDAVRAFSVQPFVTAPTVMSVTISITVRLNTATAASPAATISAVTTAVIEAVNALTAGQICYISALETAALSITGVIAVAPGTTINGIQADITPAAAQEVRTSVGSVTVSQY